MLTTKYLLNASNCIHGLKNVSITHINENSFHNMHSKCLPAVGTCALISNGHDAGQLKCPVPKSNKVYIK